MESVAVPVAKPRALRAGTRGPARASTLASTAVCKALTSPASVMGSGQDHEEVDVPMEGTGPGAVPAALSQKDLEELADGIALLNGDRLTKR